MPIGWSGSRLYYGWVLAIILGITTILSYGTTQYLFGVLVVPLAETFHWSRASISAANTLSLIIAGLLGIPAGAVLDQRGPRLLMCLGSALCGFSLLGLSVMQNEWQFTLLWAVGIGSAMALIFYPVSMTVITHWFVAKRGRALSVLTLLGGLASPIFLPLSGLLIPLVGWRMSLFLFGLLHLLIAAPLHGWFLRRAPEDVGLVADGVSKPPSEEMQEEKSSHAKIEAFEGMNVPQALREPSFWLFTMAFSFSMIGVTVLSTHQIAHLIHQGYDAKLAATLTGGLGLASLAGRFCLNWFHERLSARLLLGICHLIQATGVAVLILASSIAWVLLSVFLVGAAGGAIAPLRALVMAETFGRRSYGTITALQGIFIALCGAAGPLVAGWLYDLLGRYDLPFWLCVLGFVIAAIGILSAVHKSTSSDSLK
jgi:MFS family permease